MEKLRATWIKQLTISQGKAETFDSDGIYHYGKADAYENVIRDTEWFNEEFSKLLAEVTEFHRHADEAYRMNRDLDQQPDADHYRGKAASYKHILDKLERLNQGKEVRT